MEAFTISPLLKRGDKTSFHHGQICCDNFGVFIMKIKIVILVPDKVPFLVCKILDMYFYFSIKNICCGCSFLGWIV